MTDADAAHILHPDQACTDRPLILVSWNGREPPLWRLLLDTRPQFDLLLFDYSGSAMPAALQCLPWPVTLLSECTECKGDIYQALAKHLTANGLRPRFVGLIDDDVVLSVGDLNRLLHLGHCHGLHVLSAALSHDSHYTHRWMLHQPHRSLREVDWVEVMMPIYDGALFLAAAPHFEGNVSSWGIDMYLMPTLQQLTGCTRTAIVDAVMASHVRPVTSGQGAFRHGQTAAQENARMKQLCRDLLRRHRPELLRTDWYQRIFVQRHVRNRWRQLVTGLGRPLRRWLDSST